VVWATSKAGGAFFTAHARPHILPDAQEEEERAVGGSEKGGPICMKTG